MTWYAGVVAPMVNDLSVVLFLAGDIDLVTVNIANRLLFRLPET